MKKKQTYWYVRPADSHTNNSLARYLSGGAKDFSTLEVQINHESFWVYAVDYPTLTLLKKSQKDQSFNFKIYRRQGKNGKVEAVDLFALNKRKKQQKKA
jgi:hypothetical protein